MVRDWYVGEALHSFRRLKEIVGDLTEEEVLAAFRLERGSRRRSTMLHLLARQASKINRSSFNAKLKENIHGS